MKFLNSDHLLIQMNPAMPPVIPFFLETITYRISAHYGPNSDLDVGYRSKNELIKWINNCPIKNLENFLIQKKNLTKSTIIKLNNQYSKEIESYINAAKKDKFLKTKDLEKVLLCGIIVDLC